MKTKRLKGNWATCSRYSWKVLSEWDLMKVNWKFLHVRMVLEGTISWVTCSSLGQCHKLHQFIYEKVSLLNPSQIFHIERIFSNKNKYRKDK